MGKEENVNNQVKHSKESKNCACRPRPRVTLEHDVITSIVYYGLYSLFLSIVNPLWKKKSLLFALIIFGILSDMWDFITAVFFFSLSAHWEKKKV